MASSERQRREPSDSDRMAPRTHVNPNDRIPTDSQIQDTITSTSRGVALIAGARRHGSAYPQCSLVIDLRPALSPTGRVDRRTTDGGRGSDA
jgi:hypothetical protein